MSFYFCLRFSSYVRYPVLKLVHVPRILILHAAYSPNKNGKLNLKKRKLYVFPTAVYDWMNELKKKTQHHYIN